MSTTSRSRSTATGPGPTRAATTPWAWAGHGCTPGPSPLAAPASDGADVRIGGGPATIQQYLRAGLIDELHVAIVPTLFGRGERLFDNLGDAIDRYECTELVSSPTVTHARLTRKS